MLYIVVIVHCTPHCPQQNIKTNHILLLLLTTPTKGQLQLPSWTTHENITADISTEEQLWPPLDMVTVDHERELHKPNSRTKCKSFVVIQIVNGSCDVTIPTTFSIFFFFLLHWIEKRNSFGILL